MAYFVALASAFLVLSAGTALRPGRRGLFAALAYPVGWAAGELAGQGIFLEGLLLGILWWWGWPATSWLSVLVFSLAGVVVLENLILIVILFLSRSIVRRAMEHAPDRPLRIPRPRDDYFGSWWRTALQIPFHPRDMQLHRNVVYGPLPRHRLDLWRLSTTPKDAPVIYYLHGGAWTFGDKREQGRPMLHEFVRRGWIVVAINYRLAPRFLWPAQIEDATRALGWIKKNIATYGGDPDRVVVAGGSAGGHLASLLALSADDVQWRPKEMSDLEDWSRARCTLLLRSARDDRRRNALARTRPRAASPPRAPRGPTSLRGPRGAVPLPLTVRSDRTRFAAVLRRTGRERYVGRSQRGARLRYEVSLGRLCSRSTTSNFPSRSTPSI